jgi:hypothetical protein
VYWSELGFHSGGGSIKRMPKQGGAITTLIDGLGEVGGIALDNDYVYWTEGDSVKKIAKNATAPTFSPTISTNGTETLLGHAITITGQLNPTVDVSNVTLQYSMDNGKTWSLLTELSTDPNGSFSYDWKPTEAGKYLVRAVWEPSIRYQEVFAESTLIDVARALVGDITGGTSNLLDFVPDGKVDMKDVGIVARYFGQAVPPAPSNCDITGPTAGVPDGTIDMRDVGTVARHFGEHS